MLVGADRPEREVALKLLPHTLRGQEALICDKGYADREFAASVSELGGIVMRPAHQDEPDNGLHLSTIRQRIESILWTCKDLLTLNDKAPARSPTSAPASPAACSPSPHAYPSTTGSRDRAARSWPMSPEPAESII